MSKTEYLKCKHWKLRVKILLDELSWSDSGGAFDSLRSLDKKGLRRFRAKTGVHLADLFSPIPENL